MVDFDNETTIGTPASDVVRILILEKRNNLLEAVESYLTKDFRNIEMDLAYCKARLVTLFLEIQAAIKRKWKKEIYKDVKARVMNIKEKDQLFDLIDIFNDYLDEIRLTRIDNKKQYDASNTSEEDKEKGFS